MYQSRILVVTALLFIGGSLPAPKPAVSAQLKPHVEFHPGQVWTYNTRDGEAESILTVLRVDTELDGSRVVCVRVDGLRLRDTDRTTMGQSIDFMPLTEIELESSVVRLLSSEAVPTDSYEELYRAWRANVAKRRSSPFTISVAEAVQRSENTFNGTCRTTVAKPRSN